MLKSNFMLSYPAASFQTEQPKFIFETEIWLVQIRKLEGLVWNKYPLNCIPTSMLQLLVLHTYFLP